MGLQGPSPPSPAAQALPAKPGSKQAGQSWCLGTWENGHSLLDSSGMPPAPLGSHGSDGSLRPLPGPGTQVGRNLGLGHREQENGLDQAWLLAPPGFASLSPTSKSSSPPSPTGLEGGPPVPGCQLHSHPGASVLELHPGLQPGSEAAPPRGAAQVPRAQPGRQGVSEAGATGAASSVSSTGRRRASRKACWVRVRRSHL